ncbi:hypothetical protein EZV62_010852 [Acer yangbiense]|uniref:Retrotransposon gag domain-containing protein n=1 Tax=Acer yangbiense TaxID=1000413 RepID=A0A5C7I4D0_9ROSI|nr:hypothetical protein EZV62_010852 [Acer yangbiense]
MDEDLIVHGVRQNSRQRWLHDEISEDEMDNGSEEDVRLDRRPHGRMPIYGQQREPWRGVAVYEGDRRKERHHSRGPRKSKVYEVARANRVSTACIYLDGKANSWWRWIKAQYEQNGKQMGWMAFERDFLAQWGPLPVVNHHGQLAKLKQEGKVQAHIEEFRRLQILVRGWLEESLLGTFIEEFKPRLAREMKLKRPQRLIEAMKMAEILEDSYYSDKKPFKESSRSKNFKSESNKDSWKGKGAIEDSSKKESKDVFKRESKRACGSNAGRNGTRTIGAGLGSDGEATNDEGELKMAELGENNCEAELSLNAMSGVSKPSTMRLMAWVVGVDVVLCNTWLNSISKVVTDFDAMMMEFKLGGKKIWATLPLKEIKQCEAQMIERLCKGGAQCFAVMNVGDRQDRESEKKNKDELQDKLQRLPEIVHHEAGLMELSGVEWQVWDRIKEAM